jgi:hypothetical protein
MKDYLKLGSLKLNVWFLAVFVVLIGSMAVDRRAAAATYTWLGGTSGN